jgi:hypothetical protein
MIWATKMVPAAEVAPLRERVHKFADGLKQSSGGKPADVLLVEGPPTSDLTTRLYLGLPDHNFVQVYEGFVEIEAGALPDRATYSAGEVELFNDWFEAV